MDALMRCKQRKYSISIILPVYNEEGNIEKVIGGLKNFLQSGNRFGDYEIIVVDDGSRDNTGKILKEITDKTPNLKVLTCSKNLGYGNALITGLKLSHYPLIFLMDADGQFDIAEIKKMFIYLKNFDIIAGYRYKRKDAFYRIALAKIYSWIVSLFFKLKLKDVNCGFKLFKRKIWEEENILHSSAGTFYTEILLRAKNKGYKIKEIPVEHYPRSKGKQTGASLNVIFSSIIDLIRLACFKKSKMK